MYLLPRILLSDPQSSRVLAPGLLLLVIIKPEDITQPLAYSTHSGTIGLLLHPAQLLFQSKRLLNGCAMRTSRERVMNVPFLPSHLQTHPLP